MSSYYDIASFFIHDTALDCALAKSEDFSLFQITKGKPDICEPIYKRKETKVFKTSEYGRNPEDILVPGVKWAIEKSGGKLKKVVIGCFGTYSSLDANSSEFGKLATSTSHGRWSEADLLKIVREGTGDNSSIEIVFQTEADLAALGEFYYRVSHGREHEALSKLPSMSVKPGIENSVQVFLNFSKSVNGGICYAGKLWSGRLHPVMNAVKLQRMYTEENIDNYAGLCKIHGSCIEGMVSTAAIRDRFKKMEYCPAEVQHINEIPEDHDVWKLTAFYIARMCLNVTAILSPSLITIGGTVVWRHQVQNGYSKFLHMIQSYFNKEIYCEELKRSSPDYPEIKRPDGFIQIHADKLAGLHGGLILASDPVQRNNVTPFRPRIVK